MVEARVVKNRVPEQVLVGKKPVGINEHPEEKQDQEVHARAINPLNRLFQVRPRSHRRNHGNHVKKQRDVRNGIVWNLLAQPLVIIDPDRQVDRPKAVASGHENPELPGPLFCSRGVLGGQERRCADEQELADRAYRGENCAWSQRQSQERQDTQQSYRGRDPAEHLRPDDEVWQTAHDSFEKRLQRVAPFPLYGVAVHNEARDVNRLFPRKDSRHNGHGISRRAVG